MPVFDKNSISIGALFCDTSLPTKCDIIRYANHLRGVRPDPRVYPRSELVNSVVDAVYNSYSSLDHRLRELMIPRTSIYNKVVRLIDRARPVINGKAAKKLAENFLLEMTDFFDVLSCR